METAPAQGDGWGDLWARVRRLDVRVQEDRRRLEAFRAEATAMRREFEHQREVAARGWEHPREREAELERPP